MKITGLRTQIVEFPYDPIIGLSANNFLRTGSCVLIFLESDQGEIGEGLIYTFNGDHIKLYDGMVQSFAPLVIGKDPTQSGAIFASAWGSIRTVGQSGFAVNAVAGLDMALWDLRRQKLAVLNVSGLLGAYRTTMPVYDSGDYWNSLSLDDLRRNAKASMARGFRAFKLRLTGDIKTDVARAKSMRDVIGEKNSLLVDFEPAFKCADRNPPRARAGRIQPDMVRRTIAVARPRRRGGNYRGTRYAGGERRIRLHQPRHSRNVAC